MVLFLFFLLFFNPKSINGDSWGGLYPRESPTRELHQLDGIWDFRLAPLQDPNQGFVEQWYKQPLSMTGPVIKMAVPSSYNELSQDSAIRDHIGWAWYDRTFFIPNQWTENQNSTRIILRLGSAHYYSIVYVNGEELVYHEGGSLPFMADVSGKVFSGMENLITICVNNTLTPDTIPQGKIIHHDDLSRYPAGYFAQTLDFDFFNYAGIHRPVFLYTTPTTYIDDIVAVTDVQGTTGSISYDISPQSTTGDLSGVSCSLKLYDQDDNHVLSAIGCVGQITVADANLWWPHLMNDNPGYLYELQVSVSDAQGNLDIYPQKVGIRKITWNNTNVLINDKSMYLMGFGKHEDNNIVGRGFDKALTVKDFSLLKWIGANSFRTSHYPYAEEIMDMADREGIMVVDESPAIGLNGFGEDLMNLHISFMDELVRRDKNRPSVIMWSMGNEPQSGEEAAGNYFQQVANATRNFDSTRPVTCVLSVGVGADKAAASLDAILVNRYYGWYGDTGHLEVITRQTITEFVNWHSVHNKPVMISEYGAGSLAGTHYGPAFTWSEEYQVALMAQNFKAFDDLRRMGFFFGEMIWNFADFATPQETFRPPGCMKGVFTRNRQPKLAAPVLRYRYRSLSNQLFNTTTFSSVLHEDGDEEECKSIKKFLPTHINSITF